MNLVIKVKKCTFTSHRPQNIPLDFNKTNEFCITLKQTLRAEIIRPIEHEGVSNFTSSMLLSVDIYTN